MNTVPFLLLLALWFPGGESGPDLRLVPLTSPAAPLSAQPNLSLGPSGEAYLSWIERGQDKEAALRFSRFDGQSWSPAQTIASGDNWFVNWADFPSLLPLEDGSLWAHWLVRSADSLYAYHIYLSHSRDGGKSWSAPFRPHRDATPTEHGFVSLLPWGGGAAVVWLDGRKMAAHPGESQEHGMGEMTLRFTTLSGDGRLGEEVVLDERVCDCCQTAAVRTSSGAVVAYRDRSAEEIRDISVLVGRKGGWSKPRTVHPDGWRIPGCPVNGPSLDSLQDRVVLAWFTQGEDGPEVKVSFSRDGGESFGPPVRVDDGVSLGRVDVVLLSEDQAAVSWMEWGEEEAYLRCRRVSAAGELGPVRTVTSMSGGRASGFPRMIRFGENLLLAWTEVGPPSRVRTALLPLRSLLD